MSVAEPSTCSVPGCLRPILLKKKAMCGMHYQRERKGRPMDAKPNFKPRKYDSVCSFPGCEKPHKGRGYCAFHVDRLRRGVPLDGYKRPSWKGHTCQVEECSEAIKAGGLCSFHYARSLNGKPVLGPRKKRKRPANYSVGYYYGRTCFVRDCERPQKSRGICTVHSKKMYDYNLSVIQILMLNDVTQCPICGDGVTPDTLNIDHDHACCPENSRSCGECVRGVLCGMCNRGLGSFRDNIKSMERAIEWVSSGRLSNYV